jgi:hypothetical protein
MHLINELSKEKGFIILFFSLIFAALISVLIIQRVDGQPYLYYLAGFVQNRASLYDESVLILKYLFSPILFSDREFNTQSLYILSKISFIPILSTLIFIPIIFLVYDFIKSHSKFYNMFIVLSFISTIVVFLVIRNPKYGHHFIYIHLPVIAVLMIYSNESHRKFCYVTILLAINCAINMLLLTYSPMYAESDKSRYQIFSYLSIPAVAESSVVNFTHWGIETVQTLYGDNSQLITTIDITKKDNAIILESILLNSKRSRIINVCVFCTREELASSFPSRTITLLNPEHGSWLMWEIQ